MKNESPAKERSFLDDIDFFLDKGLRENISESEFFGFPIAAIRSTERILTDRREKKAAYLSMEFGLAPSFYNRFIPKAPLTPLNKKQNFAIFSNMRSMDYFHMVAMKSIVDMPIYSGGLGVLAGDTLKSVADLKLPLIGVGILWNKGYFLQRTCYHFGQESQEINWAPSRYPGLIPLKKRVELNIGKEKVLLRIWKYYVYSYDKQHVVPLVLLDSNLEENSPLGRTLTDRLYNSKSDWWKIVQRKVLGIGGVKAMEALGYHIDIYHLNEGHAAFAFIEIARRLPAERWDNLKQNFVYTCHTPVEAGHDRLPVTEMSRVLDAKEMQIARQFGSEKNNRHQINLTLLALSTAHKANAVSEKHEEVTKIQFPSYVEKIRGITNGIHHLTWISDPIAALFDECRDVLGDWRADPLRLKNILRLKEDKEFKNRLWRAHQENKRSMVKWLSPWMLREDVLTIAWARRAASYKRPELILYNLERLLEISGRMGPLQIIFAGKAHPKDAAGMGRIRSILEKIDSLSGKHDLIKILYLEDYDTHVGKKLVSGVDVWLNNPLPPFEASGTSGMKAILNGVVQLSTLDGWVSEADKNIGIFFGYLPPEGEIGQETDYRIKEDSNSLCQALEKLMPLYREAKVHPATGRWVDMMLHCIAAAAFFNTHRMALDYNKFAWNFTTASTTS